MLLQRLKEYAEKGYADRLGKPPAMYQEQPIAYLIELDRDGRFHPPIIPRADASSKETRRGAPMLAPHVKRTMGVRAKLLADTGEYVLGVPRPVEPEKEEQHRERVRQQHEQFVELVNGCATATEQPEVRAVAAFLGNLDLDALPLPADFDPMGNVTFIVDGELPIDLPAVRRYWARVQGAGADEDADGEAVTGDRLPCIVCGEVRPALLRHPFKIKGIPGGQVGKDLISANSTAFESYGLANSLIAPTCQRCAEAYGNALNKLLADPATHLRLQEAVYAFWTAGETDLRPGMLFAEPEPREVQQLIQAARKGAPAALDVDDTAFYALCLGPSGARVVVRDWVDTTVGEAKRRLAAYFRLQAIAGYDGRPGPPLPIRWLANATVRDPKKEAPPATVPGALLRLALVGTPLPLDLLFLAVRRIRAEGTVSRERAALIKMVLGSQPEATISEGDDDPMAELDLTNSDPAYLCGRLLAVLEAIQRQAQGDVNATIVDRYYGTAASAPATVFGTLLHGAQAHLAGLRKDPRSQRAYGALERRLEEVLAPLPTFPATLTPQQEGLFALGFYHQRAADRLARSEQAARRAGESSDTSAPAE